MRKVLVALFIFTFCCSVKGQMVYKTPYGSKYHTALCRMVKNISEQITITKAKEIGLEPCKICKPGSSYSSTSQTKTAQGQGLTVQCKGMTRADARCKHMTKIANGYCFQHQPK